MLKQHTLDMAAFAAQTWLLTPEVQDTLLAQLIEKGQVTFSLEESPIHYTDYNWAYYNEASKPGSIAVMSIKGVIYDYYADYLVNKIQMIYADKNVVALLTKMNSPGGSADAGYKISDALMNAPIETWCHIDFGQASSAGYMIAASHDGISASRPGDRVGSIGTYISYQDWSKAYEKMGVVQKDIYAEQSTEKNLEGREAAKGNFKPLQNYASQEAAAFIDYVKSRRTVLNTETMDPFKGKVFTATDALSIGLIDNIGPIKEAFSLVTAKSTTSNATPRTTMLGFIQLKTLSELKNADASAFTDEKLDTINAELATAVGKDKVVMVNAAQYAKAVEAINAQSGDANLQAEVTRLTTELTTANNTIGTLTTERDGYKTKSEAFGSQPGAQPSNPDKGVEAQADTSTDDTAKIMDSLEHNMAVPAWLRNPVQTAK